MLGGGSSCENGAGRPDDAVGDEPDDDDDDDDDGEHPKTPAPSHSR